MLQKSIVLLLRATSAKIDNKTRQYGRGYLNERGGANYYFDALFYVCFMGTELIELFVLENILQYVD